jgi:membrane protein insertase Oxa1/YidC/SpoIIIJ
MKVGYSEDDIDEAFRVVANETLQSHTNNVEKKETKEDPKEELNKATGKFKNRKIVFVLLMTIVTFGIYAIYWVVSTTNELRKTTENAPNPYVLFMLLIPVVNIFVFFYYYWKYCKAFGEITEFNPVLLLVLWFILSPAALVICQLEYNKRS